MGTHQAPTSQPSGVSTKRAFWFAAVVTLVIFLTGIYFPYFLVDSWTYFELSKSIFKDFYHVNTLRQFESAPQYSNAFPPLWPVLLALARGLADLGIYTGYVLNFFVCIGLLAALMWLFRRMDFPGWVGAACYLCLLGFPLFLAEAVGAKTIPLAVTLLTLTFVIWVRDPITMPRVALAGLLMGLACLNRFDASATAGVIGLVFAARIYLSERRFRRGIAAAAIYFAVFGAVLSPWVAYGIRHFGRPVPSPDMRQLLLARGGLTLDYYEVPPPSDLTQHPRQWIAEFLFYKVPKAAYGFLESAVESPLPILLAAVLVVWGATGTPPLPTPAVRFSALALGLIPVMLLPASLVGFREGRYYSGTVLILFAVLLAVLVSLTPGAWGSRRSTLLLLVTVLPLCPAIVRPPLSNLSHLFSPADVMIPLSPTPEMHQVTDAVHRDSGGQPHRLILTIGYIASARYGAMTGEPVTLTPTIKNGTFAAFARHWHVTHVYNPPNKSWVGPVPIRNPASVMREIDTPGVELIPLDLPGLYRIKLTSQVPTP